MAVKKTEIIEIRPIERQIVNIRIVGDTPLISHAWADKVKKEILEKQMKVTKTKARAVRNPVADFIQSMYWLTPMPEDMTMEAFEEAIANGARFGFPATAVKQAAISAAYRLGWSKDKVSLQGAFFIKAEVSGLVEIKGEAPIMREDMVTLSGKAADLRYRGEFQQWYADIEIDYNTNGQYTIEQIINMINAGGYACGIGEWRPEKSGQSGMFHVEG